MIDARMAKHMGPTDKRISSPKCKLEQKGFTFLRAISISPHLRKPVRFVRIALFEDVTVTRWDGKEYESKKGKPWRNQKADYLF